MDDAVGHRAVAVAAVKLGSNAVFSRGPVPCPMNEEVWRVEWLVLALEHRVEVTKWTDLVPPHVVRLHPAARYHHLDVLPLVALRHIIEHGREGVQWVTAILSKQLPRHAHDARRVEPARQHRADRKRAAQ